MEHFSNSMPYLDIFRKYKQRFKTSEGDFM